ncbi:unnamed protein product [Aphanomyces euteiches]|nr:hypothetical protein AeRB84_002829 [Aphanomyces euteiches]
MLLSRRCISMGLLRTQARFYSAPTISNVTVGDILSEREKVFTTLDAASQGELHPHFEQWQSIRHDASVHNAVSLMVQRNIGSLIVTQGDGELLEFCGLNLDVLVEGQGVVGIVTERDVLNKVTTDEDHENLAVKDIMSKHILCVDPSTTIMEALATMNKEKIRHLAVIHTELKETVSKDSVPIEAMRCVLSIKDILKAYAEDKKQELTDPNNAAPITNTEKTEGDESKSDVNAVTAAKLLRKKHDKINLILNTRVDDNVHVAEAVAEMVKRNFGAVMVMDDGKKIKGIFTERDYLTKVLHPKLDARELLTKDACTRNVWSLKSDDSLHTCVFEAATRNYHHFPVVDSKEDIVGVLSVKDIVREICGETKPTTGFWLMEYFKKPKSTTAEKVEVKQPEETKAEANEPKKTEESSTPTTEEPKTDVSPAKNP